jgi:glycosyltransferase involved in cell wall biosynthesis
MQARAPLVSVVCPAFQEEAVLPAFHERLSAALAAIPDCRFEVLYIDDGSADGTLAAMRKLASEDGRVRYLSLSRNFGKEAAMAAGLEHAAGDAVVILDTDLQHPPELIGELVARWRQGSDVVLTRRKEEARPGLYRRLVVGTFNRLMRWLTDTEDQPTSDYQLLSRRAVESLKQLTETHRFLRGLVGWLGYPSCVVEFEVAKRAAGHTKFTLSRLFNLASDGVLSFSRAPLRMVLSLGACLFTGGLLYGLFLLVWLCLCDWPSGLGVLVTAQVTLAGLVLGGMGVVGEYVGRIYEQVKRRPLYLLKESNLEGRAAPTREAA